MIQQFNLSSRQPDAGELTLAPAMTNHIIVHTSPFSCDECPILVINATYLIAGRYHSGEDGTTMWDLPNGKSQSMVSEWKGENGKKYDNKLQGWIAAANEYRLQQETNWLCYTVTHS